MCLFVAALRSVRDQDLWPRTRCSSSFAGQCEVRRSQPRPHLDLSGAALPSLRTLTHVNIFKISLMLFDHTNILDSFENVNILSASGDATSPAIAWFSRGSERVSHGFHCHDVNVAPLVDDDFSCGCELDLIKLLNESCESGALFPLPRPSTEARPASWLLLTKSSCHSIVHAMCWSIRHAQYAGHPTHEESMSIRGLVLRQQCARRA